MAFRFDVAGTLKPPVETDAGTLRVDGYVSRPGIYRYVNTPSDERAGLGKAGTVRRELRPDDEVFRIDSLESFDGAPVTLGHPPRMVTRANIKRYGVGVVKTAARKDGDMAAASMVIDEPDAIASVRDGSASQLSPGYRIDEVRTPGVDPKYGAYDLIQRNIRVNHLALVERARGGDECRVRLDDGSEYLLGERVDDELDAKQRDNLDDSDFAVPDGRKLPIKDAAHVRAAMSRFGQTEFKDSDEKQAAYRRILARAKKFDIDTAGFEKAQGGRMDTEANDDDTVDIALLKATIAKLEQQLAELTAARADAAKRADAAESRSKGLEQTVDELRTQLDKASAGAQRADAIRDEESAKVKTALDLLDKERADRAEEQRLMPERVNRRAELVINTRAILGNGFRTDDKSDRDLQLAIIRKLRPTLDLSALKTDEQVAARCDAIMEGRVRSARSVSAIAAPTVEAPTAPTNRYDSPQERERRIFNLANEAGPRGPIFPKENR